MDSTMCTNRLTASDLAFTPFAEATSDSNRCDSSIVGTSMFAVITFLMRIGLVIAGWKLGKEVKRKRKERANENAGEKNSKEAGARGPQSFAKRRRGFPLTVVLELIYTLAIALILPFFVAGHLTLENNSSSLLGLMCLVIPFFAAALLSSIKYFGLVSRMIRSTQKGNSRQELMPNHRKSKKPFQPNTHGDQNQGLENPNRPISLFSSVSHMLTHGNPSNNDASGTNVRNSTNSAVAVVADVNAPPQKPQNSSNGPASHGDYVLVTLLALYVTSCMVVIASSVVGAAAYPGDMLFGRITWAAIGISCFALSVILQIHSFRMVRYMSDTKKRSSPAAAAKLRSISARMRFNAFIGFVCAIYTALVPLLFAAGLIRMTMNLFMGMIFLSSVVSISSTIVYIPPSYFRVTCLFPESWKAIAREDDEDGGIDRSKSKTSERNDVDIIAKQTTKHHYPSPNLGEGEEEDQIEAVVLQAGDVENGSESV